MNPHPAHTFWIVLLLCLAPVITFSQVSDPDSDDPFSNDPLFTKSVRDWFDPDRITREVRRRTDRIIQLSGVDERYQDLTGYGKVPGFSSVSTIRPMFRFNRVEGVVLGISSHEMRWNSRDLFDVYGQINYSFGREEWLYSIGAERFFGTEKRFKAGVEYHRITDSDDGFRVGWVENSISSFFAAYDHMDYYGRQGARIFAVARPLDWVELNLAYRTDDIHNLDRNSRYSMFGMKSTYRLNPNVVAGADTARINQLVGGFRLNPSGRMQTRRFGFSGDVMVQLGRAISGMGSDQEYDRYDAELRTYFILDPSAALKIRFRVGEVVGNPTLNAMYALGGAGTIRSEMFKSMSGSSSALMNAELLLGSSNVSNANWVDQVLNFDKLRFMMFLDAGWTGAVGDGIDRFDINRMKTSLGVGVNASTLRFELAWPTSDLAGTPVLWVRLNPTF